MSYFFRTIFIVLIAFIQCSLIAQESSLRQFTSDDYQNFKTKFEAEFDVIGTVKNDNEQTDKNSSRKIELPEWFFLPHNSNQNKIYAIGISDPLMLEKEAEELALLRAKALCGLVSGVEISGVSDLFVTDKTIENKESKYSLYQDFFTFQSRKTYNDSLFKKEAYHYNSNGEAMVLLSYLASEISNVSDTCEMVIYADLYEAYKEGKLYNPHNTMRFELLVGARKAEIENSDYFTFLLKRRNKSINLETNFNGVKSTFESSSFYYHSNTTMDSIDVSGQVLEKGLWNAYAISLFKAMGIKMDGKADIQKMEDHTIESNHEIIRIKKTNQIQLNLGSINIYQNKLYIDLDVSDINKTGD